MQELSTAKKRHSSPCNDSSSGDEGTMVDHLIAAEAECEAAMCLNGMSGVPPPHLHNGVHGQQWAPSNFRKYKK